MQNFQVKNYLWSLLKYFANLNLSIFILSLIGIFGVIGSIIEQDQSISYYELNYPFVENNIFSFNWKCIVYLGWDHVFQTWWFLTTLLIFIVTLLSCTLVTQLPSLKNARRWKFFHSNTHSDKKFALHGNYGIQDDSLIAMIYSLLNFNFFIFYQKRSLYSYKGLYGRIAPIFVHISIVMILIGSMTSFLYGFTAQEMVPTGEVFHIRHIVKSGTWSRIPSNLMGYVQYFHIDYTADGYVRQFFSNVDLSSSDGMSFISKMISVNHPLHYYNVTFYQTDWALDGLKIRINNQYGLQRTWTKTVINGRNCWISSLLFERNKPIFFVMFQLNDPISVFSSNGLMIGKILVKEVFYINKVSFVVDDLMLSTGLQIKSDFGINVVYTGFFVLMLSTVLSYLSYSQIWFCKNISICYFSALTNRAIFFFEEDIASINLLYTSCLFDKFKDISYLKKTVL